MAKNPTAVDAGITHRLGTERIAAWRNPGVGAVVTDQPRSIGGLPQRLHDSVKPAYALSRLVRWRISKLSTRNRRGNPRVWSPRPGGESALQPSCLVRTSN